MDGVHWWWVMQQDSLPKHTILEVNVVMLQSTEKRSGEKYNLKVTVSFNGWELLYILSLSELEGFISVRKWEVVLQYASCRGLLFYPRKLVWSISVFNLNKIYIQNTGSLLEFESDDGTLNIACSNIENTSEVPYILHDRAGNSAVHWR